MDLIKLLRKQREKYHKADMMLDAIGKSLKMRAVKKYSDRFDGIEIMEDGRRYLLLGVRASFYASCGIWSESNEEIEITFCFIANWKFSKLERERVAKAKESFSERKRFPWNEYKIPLWLQKTYNIDLNDAILGTSRFDFEKNVFKATKTL